MYCKVPNNAYLCTQKIKDHAPAFGLTRTISFVRRSTQKSETFTSYTADVDSFFGADLAHYGKDK